VGCTPITTKQTFIHSWPFVAVRRPAPKSVVLEVEAVVFRSVASHRFMCTPAGLHAVVTLVTALAMHTHQPIQANTTGIAAFMVPSLP
jgi:hypothetical protein